MVANRAAVTLEDISRDAMAADLGAAERQAWIDDALACIRAAYEAVRDRHGVRLEPEVRLIGFARADLDFLEAP